MWWFYIAFTSTHMCNHLSEICQCLAHALYALSVQYVQTEATPSSDCFK